MSSFFHGDKTPIYVDRIAPKGLARNTTIVLLHGGAHSGACYLATADGRPGWAYDFAGHGYTVLVPDWPGVGRSGAIDFVELTGEVVCTAIGDLIAAQPEPEPVILVTHSVSGAYGWRILERYSEHIAALVAIAPGPPGNIQAAAREIGRVGSVVEIEPTGLAAFKSTMFLDLARGFLVPKEVARHKLIGSSSRFPTERLDPYLASLLPVPPTLFYQRLNVGGCQIRIENAAGFRAKPIAVVTGDCDTDHPREVDDRIVRWLREIGADCEAIYLPDRGIAGNGHMMMLERNSGEIADLIVGWIAGVCPG
jgi:pimeloyl-ACP methyl ester carboxylesterase